VITKIDTEEIVQKTEELCQTIIGQNAFQDLRTMIDTFADNQEAIMQYERFMNKQNRLQQKQRTGEQLTQEEIEDFEQEDYNLFQNQTIRQFIYAQKEFERIHSLVSTYVVKSIELNRLPEEADFQSNGCGCGGNCGCGDGGSCGCGDGGSCACG
jgi:cell fate (sporulation/competence/biofilm development) regulator YlbF (YheA/YmcA/DUF963 family)